MEALRSGITGITPATHSRPAKRTQGGGRREKAGHTVEEAHVFD